MEINDMILAKFFKTEINLGQKRVILLDMILLLTQFSLLFSIFILPTILVGALGLFLGVLISLRWGFKKGLLAASWLSLVLVLNIILNPVEISLLHTAINIGAVFLILATIGKAIDLFKEQKNLFKAVIEAIPDAIIVQNLDYTIEAYNEAAAKMMGERVKEIEGKKCYELLGYQKECENCVTKSAIKDKALAEKEKYIAKDDRYLNCRSQPIINEQGEVIKVIEQIRDITDYKQAQIELKEKNTLLNGILESIDDGISVLSDDLTIRYTNQKMREWHKKDLPLEGRKCFKVYRNRDEPCEICPTLDAIKSGQPESEEIKNPFKSKVEWLELFSYPMKDRESGEVIGVVEFIRDVTKEKRSQKQREYITYHDELTKLYNRAYLEKELKRLDKRSQLPISIIMIDVNGLKLVNDAFGHKKGDRLLIKTAEILENSFRGEDIIARLGGDEFIVILPKTAQKEAEEIKKRVKKNAKASTDLELPLSFAIGLATKNSPKQNLELIRQDADADMYQNKLEESKDAKGMIMNSLNHKLKLESAETYIHTINLQKLSFKLGEAIDLSEHELERLSLLASLHDVGKVIVDESILVKEDSLDAQEWEVVKEHSKAGYRIASSTDEFAHIANDILHHHEHWSGQGYPEGLKEDEIPLLARIISIVDAYDVMTSDRPYQSAMSKQAAKAELKAEAGNQFDPELVEVFLEVIE